MFYFYITLFCGRFYIFFLYSVALVRERTILIELPPLVDEVNANFCG
jgi:hypothetical protein